MDKEKCKDCNHYDFYKMITEGAYSYSGFIPCLHCCHYTNLKDYFVEKEIER